MLKVNEIFVSYQGEGPLIGVPSLFVRLQGCNLACSWCDSKESIKNSGGTEMTAKQIMSVFPLDKVNNVVITGGEPLLQQDDPEFGELLDLCIGECLSIEIETNGTIVPNFDRTLFVSFNVSPKLTHSGMGHRCSTEAIKHFTDYGATFKFVIDVDYPYPLSEVGGFVEMFEIYRENVYLMAEGTSVEAVMRGTAKLMQLEHQYNVSTRAHILFDVK